MGASYIGQIERDIRKASLKTLGTLAKSLGVRVSSFFDPAGPLAKLPLGEKLETVLASHTKKERALLLDSLRHLAKGLKTLR